MGQGAEPWAPWVRRGFRLGEAVQGLGSGSVRFGLGLSSPVAPGGRAIFPALCFALKRLGHGAPAAGAASHRQVHQPPRRRGRRGGSSHVGEGEERKRNLH